MDRKNFCEALDLFCDLNDTLEICRGYTQTNEPDLKVLDTVLYKLQNEYRAIYEQLADAVKRAAQADGSGRNDENKGIL